MKILSLREHLPSRRWLAWNQRTIVKAQDEALREQSVMFQPVENSTQSISEVVISFSVFLMFLPDQTRVRTK